MRSPAFESVLVRLTQQEHQLLVRLMEVRDQSSSDVLRELLGLPSEHEVTQVRPRRRLRLVSAALAPTEHSKFASGA
jgi:hypothetical protein